MWDQTGNPEEYRKLADQIWAVFDHAARAELPERAVRLPEFDDGGTARNRAAVSHEWGGQPVMLLALDREVVLQLPVSHRCAMGSVTLRQGEAVFLRARDFHGLRSRGRGMVVGFEAVSTQPCRFFIADASAPTATRREIELNCAPFAEALPECWQASHEAYCLMESALRYPPEPGGGGKSALASALRLAVREAGRALALFRRALSGPVEKSNAARVGAAEAFIACNLGRDIRKNELAEHIGVSVSQLTLAFREVGRLAVRDRIRFHRVESARNLLADTDLSVAQVAERVGLNYRHFIRAFRQSTGLTPLRFRKLCRSSERRPDVLRALLHAEHFEVVDPLDPDTQRAPQVAARREGAISILVSNASAMPAVVSRSNGDGTFHDLGVTAPGKRLAFLEQTPGRWKVEVRGEHRERGGGARTALFEPGEGNSHFIYGLPETSADPSVG